MRITRATSALLAVPGTTLPSATAAPRRTIHDAAHATTLPGKVVRNEGDLPTRDAETDEAYDGLGATYAYYLQVHQRHSIDDAGMPLEATVHYGKQYDNAFWNGTQMVFGDGDGDLFNRFTVSLDVIAHELTHGVTEDEARLVYVGQSGALNESLSDVFGSLVKQYARKQTAAKADWLIGEGLFTAKVHGVALRSLKAPGTAFDDPLLGKDDQPATMDGYVRTSADNGGVHTNSGIPNHAFYLAATAFGGHAWEKAGVIWYAALRDKALKPTATFAAFAERTSAQADRLFGATAQQVIAEAWRAVGVTVAGGARVARSRRT
ncbi:MAG: M4 family metallopeptidase [Proteobacteria bacterium]|nr:M4 family metallopeptidase [Pseudomonadota bacterium]